MINPNEQVLFLPIIYGTEKIKISSIIRIEAISNYSKIFFADGKTLVVAKVLRWFDEKLPVQQFIRVHRTHFVNKSFMRQYNNAGKVKLFSGELKCCERAIGHQQLRHRCGSHCVARRKNVSAFALFIRLRYGRPHGNAGLFGHHGYEQSRLHATG